MILTIDQGTTSSRALVIDKAGKVLAIAQKEFKQIYPQPAWVEHDPKEIWQTTLEVCREAIGKLDKPEEIKGLAITNQRETTIVWDKNTGEPVYNAIVWQCRRTADYCTEMKANTKFAESVREKTGLLIDSYFSAPKISWILNKDKRHGLDDASSKALDKKISEVGIDNLLFGTIDTWILWNLTEGKSHLTEPSNASRTMVYNIEKGSWDKDLLNELNIPDSILPTVIASNSLFGRTALFKDLVGKDLDIKAILGDQQAAWYGHKSMPKITYGTGSFVLLPQQDAALVDGLVTTIGYQKESTTKKVLEASIFVAGAIVQWLRDGLKIIKKSSDVEALAAQVKDNGGVYLVPALVGLGAPHWQEQVRGTIFGISRGTSDAHIARAALESIAFSVKDAFHQLEKQNPDLKLEAINVDGGASKNDFLMQFQADLLGIEIHRFDETEMTALGVARMTGNVDYEMQPEKVFKPQRDLSDQYQTWSGYLQKLL